jgi:hypothetical protein
LCTDRPALRRLSIDDRVIIGRASPMTRTFAGAGPRGPAGLEREAVVGRARREASLTQRARCDPCSRGTIANAYPTAGSAQEPMSITARRRAPGNRGFTRNPAAVVGYRSI